MAAENETKSILTKITEAVTAFIGKFTGAQEGAESGKTSLLDTLKNLLNGQREGVEQAGEKLADVGEKIAGKASEFKDKIPMPEGVEKGIGTAKEKAGEVIGKLTKNMDPEKVDKLKQGGLMAGGAAATLDGVRRMTKKDENGKRHVVKGALEAGAGIGMFTAAVIARRNGASNDGPQR